MIDLRAVQTTPGAEVTDLSSDEGLSVHLGANSMASSWSQRDFELIINIPGLIVSTHILGYLSMEVMRPCYWQTVPGYTNLTRKLCNCLMGGSQNTSLQMVQSIYIYIYNIYRNIEIYHQCLGNPRRGPSSLRISYLFSLCILVCAQRSRSARRSEIILLRRAARFDDSRLGSILTCIRY